MDRQTEVELPDIELIKAVQQGDKAAFNVLEYVQERTHQ